MTNLQNDLFKKIIAEWIKATGPERNFIVQGTIGEIPPTYKYHMNNTLIEILLSVWRYVVKNGSYEVDITKTDLHPKLRPSVTKARYFGLITRSLDSKGEHKGNKWKLTHLGAEFLHGRKGVRKYVEVRKNRIVNRSLEKVYKSDFSIIMEFKPQYEIVGGRVKKVTEVKQMGFGFTNGV